MRQLKCHHCRSAKLILHETRYEHGQWDGGLYLTETGAITAQGIGYFNPGEIQPKLTEIECEDCGHAWHPRRKFLGTQL